MRSRRRSMFAAIAALSLTALAAAALAAAGGWTDNGISLELKMVPGDVVSFEREGAWPSSSRASIRMSSDNVNTRGNDYVPSEAQFPVSVTFAFGKDSVSIGFWSRVGLFFRNLRRGFPPYGIRLTYAWGNRVPAGSMYRLEAEETVFTLAGADDTGKEISGIRRLSEDFRAAYGRPPNGPVTAVRVRVQRASGEKGPLAARLSVRFPAD